MLRDPEDPELSWEDSKKLLAANPERPFYAPGKTLLEQFAKAQKRCDEYERRAQYHSDCAGGIYWTCEKDKTDD
ncbi:hypothetical protein [Microcoleus sp. CAWBG58]|uniref:hypothetical protein n=1 Tax=Microcoleus sp. CAWBG58 TaxID=2841651 RepID=UPI0025CC1A4C|nr:hypothetical protein [Microcoleus sp. CAWBG58]